MGPGEIISAGEALGRLGAVGILSVVVIVLALLAYRLWRDAKSDSKEAATTYINLLKEQFSDANRRKDLFDEIGKSIQSNAQETRELRQEIMSFRSDFQRRA